MTTDNLLSDHAIALADLRARTAALEQARTISDANFTGLSNKLDSLKMWMMTTLAAALGGLLAQLLHR